MEPFLVSLLPGAAERCPWEILSCTAAEHIALAAEAAGGRWLAAESREALLSQAAGQRLPIPGWPTSRKTPR